MRCHGFLASLGGFPSTVDARNRRHRYQRPYTVDEPRPTSSIGIADGISIGIADGISISIADGISIGIADGISISASPTAFLYRHRRRYFYIGIADSISNSHGG